MKKLNKKFWGTFVKNSKYGNPTKFENFVDVFVSISEFDSMEELNSVFVSERFVFKGFEDGKNCKMVLLENADDFSISIVTSAEYFAENKIELLNEVIESFGDTTTSKGIEPIYELIDIEVIG